MWQPGDIHALARQNERNATHLTRFCQVLLVAAYALLIIGLLAQAPRLIEKIAVNTAGGLSHERY